MMSHNFVVVQATRCDVKVYYIIFSDFISFYLRTFIKTLKTLEHFVAYCILNSCLHINGLHT